jgi:hypothetical protein
MRNIIFAAALAIAGTAFGGTANADPYRWCAEYGSGGRSSGTNCYFMTIQQCQSAISGVGGFCRPNPFYTGRQSSREGRRRAF